jgi:p-methyltransferase
MLSYTNLDCVVVGYNDHFLGAVPNERGSYPLGIYNVIKSNSLIFHGKRKRVFGLLNHVITKATGQNPHLHPFEAPTLAVFYLKSYLQKKNFEVEIINFFNYELEKFKKLLSRKPRAVAITTTFYVHNAPIIDIVKFVQEYSPDSKIIVGGPRILDIALGQDEKTQESIFEQIGADIYVINSQGENSLSQVLGSLQNGEDLSRIPNLLYKNHDGTFLRTWQVVENNDMDENSVEWSFFDRDFLARQAVPLRTSRSCPYACSFCSYPAREGAYVLSSVEVIERELKTLHEAGTRFLNFVDDTFNIPIDRFKQLLRMMIHNQFNFRWISFLRCSNVDVETLDLMQESGCIGVFLGIESGDQTILKNMKKGAKIEKYQWAIGELKRRNINQFVSLICGFPGETEQTVMNTINFIEESKPTFYFVELYYCEPQSPIIQRAAEFELEGFGFDWKHRTMDSQEAAEWVKYMYKNIKNSIPCITRLWHWFFLVSRGIPIEKIEVFTKMTKELLLNSLEEDFSIDSSFLEQELIDLFRDTWVTQSPLSDIDATWRMVAHQNDENVCHF